MPRAESNGIELHYEEWGDGPPLLLIMGIGCQWVYWSPSFLEQLAADFRVIAFDNRDVGESTILTGTPATGPMLVRRVLGLPIDAPYTFSDMAADAIGLLDHLGIDGAHVAGISMGGMIAQTMALEHEERVASLTSIASTPGNRRYIGTPSAMKALLGPMATSREEAIARSQEIMSVIGSPRHQLPAEEIRRRSGLSWDRCSDRTGFARQFAATLASGSRARLLPGLSTPTLVIHGEEDPLVPCAAGRATARLIPNAELLTIPEMGHDLPEMAWARIISGIRRVAGVR